MTTGNLHQVPDAGPITRSSFAIGVLSTTALILFVGLVLLHSRPQPAMADGMTVSGGDYVMTVGALSRTDEQVVYVIDAPQERMIIYRFDAGRQRIDVVQGIDLREMRQAAEEAIQRPPAGRRP